MIVGRYGIHVAPGPIPFLLQRSSAFNLVSTQLRSPFEPHIRPRNTRCPHDFDLTQTDDSWVPSSDFEKAFLPYGKGAVWIHDPTGVYKPTVRQLIRLSNPTQDVDHVVWLKGPEWMRPIYQVSNLGVIVVTGAEVTHTDAVQKHIAFAEASDRRLVIVSKERLPLFDIPRVEPHDVEERPYEQLGAGLIRRYMEGIQDGRHDQA